MRVAVTKIERGRRAGFFLTLLACALLPAPQVPRSRAQSVQQPSQQGPTQPGAQEDDGRPRRGQGNNLMRRLNLTPEQREQLREIRRQGEPEARELTRRVRQARRALDEAIYADSVDEALVEQRGRALSEAQAAALRLRAATELKVRRILTPAQLQTFRELRRQAQRQQLLRRRQRNGQLPQTPPEN